MAYPQYVPYTMRRAKKNLPLWHYFIILAGLKSGAVTFGYIRALAGLLNTTPVPKFSPQQVLFSIFFDCCARGEKRVFRDFLEDIILQKPSAKSPRLRYPVEK